MERTEYFNHTRPTETQLNGTEDSKIRAILRRFRSTCQMGIRTGFVVTVNSGDATLIDIGPGEGYGGGFYSSENIRGQYSGERISTITDSASGESGYQATVTGQALATYTAGSKNYVCLVYGESSSEPLSERYYPFTSHDTIIAETYSVSVLTETQWNALTSDQLDLRILIAIVTANGAGTALTAASIQQFVQPKTHPTAAQPSSITGVTISGISQEMIIGSATLRYENSTKKLYWTSPGDAEGTGVQVTSNGTYTLYSNTTTYWINVTIEFSNLPTTDTTETISITSLYGRTVPILSAIDQAHRDMLGSGQPTATNPHGLTLNDIGGGILDHADYFHVNGISKDSTEDFLEPSIASDTVEILNSFGTQQAILIDGATYTSITGVTIGSSGIIDFDSLPQPDTGRYLIYLDSGGSPQKVFICGSLAPLANVTVVNMKNTSAGNGTLTWNATSYYFTWQAPGDSTAGDPVYVTTHAFQSGYYKIYSSDTNNWIIVYCNGVIGASNSVVLATDIESTNYSKESMLDIASVSWDLGTETLSELIDLRRFVTADNREEVEEEHDESGNHTKILRNTLTVAAGENAIRGYAITNGIGVYGHAHLGGTGVYGRAQNTVVGGIGVYGYAAIDSGVYGRAARHTGVYGYAVSNTGVMGSAAIDTGVYGKCGTGQSIGVKGSAPGGKWAVVGEAGVESAVYGTAPQYGVVGLAGNLGGYFSASSNWAANYVIGVYGAARNSADAESAVGVSGYAQDIGATGVCGSAVASDGVGLFGAVIGESAIAVYGIANHSDATAGYFVNSIDGGTALSAVAISGRGANITGNNIACYMSASHSAGIGAYGLAPALGKGVVGIAGLIGGWFEASGEFGVAVSASGAYVALDLRSPAADAPADTVAYLPLRFNGVEYTVRLWSTP